MTSHTAVPALRQRGLRLATLVSLFTVTVLGSTASLGTERPDSNRFLVAPYVWAAGFEAELGLGPISLPVDVGFADALSHIEYGAMGYLQWDLGNHFLFADAAIAGMDSSGFEPFFNEPVQADMRIVEAGYGRHFLLKPGSGPIREILFSPHVSILHGSLDGKVSGSFDMEMGYDWTGMAIGGTLSAAIDSRFTLSLRTVHSGFSGDLKDFFNAMIALRCRMSDRIALGIGYRVASARYSSGDAAVDLDLKGALLGVELSW